MLLCMMMIWSVQQMLQIVNSSKKLSSYINSVFDVTYKISTEALNYIKQGTLCIFGGLWTILAFDYIIFSFRFFSHHANGFSTSSNNGYDEQQLQSFAVASISLGDDTISNKVIQSCMKCYTYDCSLKKVFPGIKDYILS